MRFLGTVLTLTALLAIACGGSDDEGDTTGTTSSATTSAAVSTDTTSTTSASETTSTAASGTSTTSTESTTGASGALDPEADRIAHEGLPELEDLPGDNWVVVATDQFSGDDDSFGEFIQGNPDCESLSNLATLEDVFGGDEEDVPIGQSQVEFEQQDPNALFPTSVEVEIEMDESAGGSQAAFAIVRELFESDDTSNCIISMLNSQLTETGPEGTSIEISKGTSSAEAPNNGARMAFNMDITILGIELKAAMQMYFWPYENASVQAMFLGSQDALTAELVGDVLKATDENLKTAAGN